MRLLWVLIVLASMPAVAADYSSWPGHDVITRLVTDVELAKNGDGCCKHCTKGQPCGNTCISTKSKCKSPPGCAC